MPNQYKNAGRGRFSPKLVARATEAEKLVVAAAAAEIEITESELIRGALAVAFNLFPLDAATARKLQRAGWLRAPAPAAPEKP